MAGTINLLFKNEYQINDNIKIIIPTVREISEQEENYYNIVSIITAKPIDLMVQLDDAGIDFSKINDYELFLIMFCRYKNLDNSLIFGDLDLSTFEINTDEESSSIVLGNPDGIKIDRMTYARIAATLRKINHLKEDRRKPGNDDAKEYMLERARIKMKRRSKRHDDSQLESLIVAMVNNKEFKYDYETVKDLTIYQFNESVSQIIKKTDYDNRMHGVYSGTVSVKDLKKDDLNWLTHK